MLTIDKDDWTLVGHFGVDAGLVWIGDPCYILHTKEGLPKTLGKDWYEFCDLLGDCTGPTMKSFNYALGHEGLGVVCSTGMGDGAYPVYAYIIDDGPWGKRIAGLFVDFYGLLSDDESEDEDDCTDNEDEDE